MRNLKRTLSLVLAALMLIGMMVVGASAAGVDDFSDKDQIVNKDAVSMLTILGVVNGKEDGSYFDPTGDVTRAEMAKMIATILNQGADVNDLYANLNTGLTDISNSWAKGYINYCYSLGIIAGRGDGTFDPLAPVTGNEAAKMLLVAIGYDPEIEGLTGATWAIKTTALASTLGIFDDLTAPTQDNLTRDNAALLIYNALDVEMIQKYEDGYAITFADSRTLLSNKYGVYKVEGVVTANKWAALNKTDSDAALRDGKTTLDNVVVYSSTTSNTTVAEGVKQQDPVTFSVDTPVNYMGKAVTMYIKKTTILANSTVLGVTLNDNVNVVSGTAAKSDTIANFLKGTGVSVDNSTEYYVNYGYYKSESTARAQINDYVVGATSDKFNLNGIEVEVIDNNNDGTADYVLYTQETLSKVKSYSEKNEAISFWTPSYGSDGKLTNKAIATSENFEDVVFNDQVSTDDVILYVQYGGRTYISLPEIVTGKMTRVDRDKSDELYITVGDKTYKQSYILDAATLVDVDLTRFVIDNAKDEPGFDTEYDFILDSNGYVIAIRPAEETVANYALVLDSAWTQNALDYSGQVKVLMADGTVDTYTINWTNSAKAFNNITNIGTTSVSGQTNNSKLETYLGTRDVAMGPSATYATGAAKGSIITYTLSDDKVLTITSVLQGNDLKTSSNEIKDNVRIDTTAGVGDNGSVIFMNNASDYSLQYKAPNGYTAGKGSLTVQAQSVATTKTYAIDKNTVAFYYNGDDDYGVATGWDHMSTVANNTEVQVYPVLTKTAYKTYEASNLAGVVLFEAVPTTTATNYMLVLSANAIGKDLLELNVVFEDGTASTVKIDKYDSVFDPEDNDSYMKAYNYSENADGTYNIGSRVENVGTAKLLINGTVDSSLKGYVALSGKANVWDVSDVTKGGEDVSTGSFSYNTACYAVIVMDNGAIRTAWIWDIPADETPGDGVVNESILVDFDPVARSLKISVTGAEAATFAEKRDAVKAEAAKVLGVKASDITVEITSSGDWVITDKANGDVYTCVAANVDDVHVAVTTADKNTHLNYTQACVDAFGSSYQWALDLVKSGYVTFDTFDIFATGSNAITIRGTVNWHDVSAKVPGFDDAGSGTTKSIHDLYCTGGSATAQNDLKNSTKFAIIALYDEAGAAKYILIGNDPAYNVANGSQTTVNLNGTAYTINLDLD